MSAPSPTVLRPWPSSINCGQAQQKANQREINSSLLKDLFRYTYRMRRLFSPGSSSLESADLISRNRCKLDDITTPGLRCTTGGKWILLVSLLTTKRTL